MDLEPPKLPDQPSVPTTPPKLGVPRSRVAIASLVLGLLAFLVAAIIAPVLENAKKMHATVDCMHNIKNLGDSLWQYADARGVLPQETNWCDAIFPVIRINATFRCPTAPKAPCGYSFNTRLAGKPIKDMNPQTVMLFESNGGWNSSGGLNDVITNRGHLHITLVDGSVFDTPASSLSSLRWNP